MTGPLIVDQEVDGAEHTVSVTMPGAIDRIIDLLVGHDGIRYHLALLQDLPATSLHHELARNALRQNAALRAALTEQMTPEEAERVRDELDAAALAPDLCRYPGCSGKRVDADWCTRHLVEVA